MNEDPSKPQLAFFGEHGSFSHRVARQRFGHDDLFACPTVEVAFEHLVDERYTHIVVPIENATSGMITNTVDQLIALAVGANPQLAIRESITLRIHLALLARSKAAKIKRIYSHLAPFRHAHNWLKKHYPDAKQIVVNSTSEAARRAREEKDAAAIAGHHAAELYNLKVVRDGVGKEIKNQTTFLVVGLPLSGGGPLGRKAAAPTHTMLVFEVPHKPGALFDVLQPFAREKLNLTKIESRPIPGRFSEYRFMLEFEGIAGQANFDRAMRRVRKMLPFCNSLGSYPLRKMS